MKSGWDPSRCSIATIFAELRGLFGHQTRNDRTETIRISVRLAGPGDVCVCVWKHEPAHLNKHGHKSVADCIPERQQTNPEPEICLLLLHKNHCRVFSLSLSIVALSFAKTPAVLDLAGFVFGENSHVFITREHLCCISLSLLVTDSLSQLGLFAYEKRCDALRRRRRSCAFFVCLLLN